MTATALLKNALYHSHNAPYLTRTQKNNIIIIILLLLLYLFVIVVVNSYNSGNKKNEQLHKNDGLPEKQTVHLSWLPMLNKRHNSWNVEEKN